MGCVVACSGFSSCFVGFTHMDNAMDCVKVRTLSFAAIQCDGFACFSQLTSGKYKLVEGPGESHEGVGRKKRGEPWFPRSAVLFCPHRLCVLRFRDLVPCLILFRRAKYQG